MAAQLSTFFVFLSALMVQVDAVHHQAHFADCLTVVTFVPPLIGLCSALHALRVVMIEPAKEHTSKSPASADGAADPESSPASPLARNAPPQEDEEAPAVAQN